MDFRAAVEGRALGHGGMAKGDFRGAVEGRWRGALAQWGADGSLGADLRRGADGSPLGADVFRRSANSGPDIGVGERQRYEGEDDGVSSGCSGESGYDNTWQLECHEREAALPSCTEAFESQPLADSGYKVRPCDWDSRHVWAFDKAFTQIRNNLDIVDDYFADLARDGDCIKRYFDGTKELHLVPLTECEDVHYSAKAFYGINRIRLNKHFVTAVYNSYHDSDCGSGDGACACAIVGLAGLLLHEASHICADNEILAHLLRAFYQFKFKENHGYEPADWCCAQNFGAEGGWAPGDWSRVTLNAAFGGDGQQSVDALPHSDTEPWRLGVCGKRPVEWYSP